MASDEVKQSTFTSLEQDEGGNMESENPTITTKSLEESAEFGSADQFRQPTPTVRKEEAKKFFSCADCGLNEEYDYFGKNPPFCRAIKFLDDSYVVRDPFSARSGNNSDFLLLGSHCTVCSRMTCQDCSVFFTKRFCAQCFKLCSAQLPEELLKSKKKAKD